MIVFQSTHDAIVAALREELKDIRAERDYYRDRVLSQARLPSFVPDVPTTATTARAPVETPPVGQWTPLEEQLLEEQWSPRFPYLELDTLKEFWRFQHGNRRPSDVFANLTPEEARSL